MFTDKKGRAHGNLAQRPWYTIRSPEGAKEETAVLLAWEATRWGREEGGGGHLLTSALRTRPRLLEEDRGPVFAIITQGGPPGQETDPSCSSTTDYVRAGPTYRLSAWKLVW